MCTGHRATCSCVEGSALGSGDAVVHAEPGVGSDSGGGEVNSSSPVEPVRYSGLIHHHTALLLYWKMSREEEEERGGGHGHGLTPIKSLRFVFSSTIIADHSRDLVTIADILKFDQLHTQ